MKTLRYLSVLLVLAASFSCSDTDVVTNEKAIVQHDEPTVVNQFTRRVLIEDFTGTWCGNCTRVAQAIEKVNLESDKAVVVGVHNGNDPYNYLGIEPLRAMLYPDSPDFPLPTVRLDRTITWTFPEPENVQQAIDLTGSNCGLGLAMTSVVSGGNVSLDVSVKFASDYSNLRLVVYALEDHLIHNQTNYSGTYYNGENPIHNFEHNHVLRASLTNILGNPISENTLKGETVIRNFSIPVPSTVTNAANLNFVAFVIDANNTVVNVRAANANTAQDFEENQ